MAWVVESDGSASLRADELGDLLSSKVRVVVERATWGSTGYLFSQAANTAANRELGLYISNSQFQLYAGGQSTSLATTASLTIDDDTVDLTVDYVNETAILIVGGVEYFNGAINVGTGRFPGTPFVFFARAGGYDAPSGTRVGNTQIYIDDVLTYNYDFDNSSHGAGTVTVDETISANDAIATGLPTDGSAWVDLGSGGSVDINETTSTSSSLSKSDSVLNVGEFDVQDSINNSFSLSNSDAVLLSAAVNIIDSTSTSTSNSLSDSVILLGELQISDSVSTTGSISNNDAVLLSAQVSIDDSTTNSVALSNNDSVLLVGAFDISDSTNNSSSLSNSDNVNFSSTFNINDSVTNSTSNSKNDSVLFVGAVNITDSVNSSNSVSNSDTVSLVGEFVLTDSVSLSISTSNTDSVLVGEFSFVAHSATNITQRYQSTNVTQTYYSTNVHG